VCPIAQISRDSISHLCILENQPNANGTESLALIPVESQGTFSALGVFIMKTKIATILSVAVSMGLSEDTANCLMNINFIDTISSKIVEDNVQQFHLWRVKASENDSIARMAISDYNLRQAKVNRNILLGSIAYSASWIGVIILGYAAQKDNDPNTGIPGWMEYSIGVPLIALNFSGLILSIPMGIVPKYSSHTAAENILYSRYRPRNASFGILEQ
jgi:hypothetical protein